MIRTDVIGHIGKDATVNNVNGKSVINFSVAHSHSYKDHNGEKKTNTVWVECAYWVERLTISKYLLKGTLVHISGTPEIRMYTNKEGRIASSLKVNIKEISLLGNGAKPNNEQANPSGPQTYDQPAAYTSPIHPSNDEPGF
jgi:single-strand DNA-binding protein